jgi:hypothetical protein
MWEDPIVAEVHRVREEFAARFNNDLRAMTRYLQEKARQEGRTLVSFPPRRVQPAEPAAAPPGTPVTDVGAVR